jgi:polysaccharide export outer membrane protein
MALRLVAQGLDTEHQTQEHSRALAAGWTALVEADDFIPHGSRLEAELDLAGTIAGHQTPVLKDVAAEDLVQLTALQCYFTFAQEQLARAAGEEVAGSMALHGLGNLYRALDAKRSPLVRGAMPKAVLCYQAALLVSPHNHMASNELGVVLARGGRHQEARAALEHSVREWDHPAGWHNLAVVYQRLGLTDLAEQAKGRCQTLRQAQGGAPWQNTAHQVEWVPPSTFAGWFGEHPRLGAPAPSSPLSMRCKTSPAYDARWGAAKFASTFSQTSHACSRACGAGDEPGNILLCQALGPAAPCNVCAVDCSCCDWSHRGGWEGARAIAWQAYAQGEYVGHDRIAHVPEYRLRVDDELDLVYRLTREETSTPYRLNVGDEVRVESFTDQELNRDLIIQPDGTITLRLLGQVRATGRTVPQLRDALEEAYKQYYPVPAITVTPLKVNTQLEDLRAVVDSRYGRGGQNRQATITPEGTIALPVIGSVQAQGLTLAELQQELNEAHRERIQGMEIIPVLVRRAPRFVYVLGEVGTPGRFELTGPTTVLQALSMAGSWNVGANLRQIVIFRRGDDWRLMATMVDLQAALHGKKACPAGEIWLSDSDLIIVPKSRILRTADFIELVFTRGIYGVLPVQTTVSFSKLSTI